MEVIGLYLFFLPGRRFLCLKWNHGESRRTFLDVFSGLVQEVLKFVNCWNEYFSVELAVFFCILEKRYLKFVNF